METYMKIARAMYARQPQSDVIPYDNLSDTERESLERLAYAAASVTIPLKHTYSGMVQDAIPENVSHGVLADGIKGAIACLCQNATHASDVAHAVAILQAALVQDSQLMDIDQ